MDAQPQYRALVGVTWLHDADQIARVKRGDRVPAADRITGRAELGELLPADVPAGAIESMLNQGFIELVAPAPTRRSRSVSGGTE